MENGLDARGEAPPSDNLYVSELPPETTEETLRVMFGPGVTQCKVLPSKIPGSCRVALVRFSSVKEATTVREILNGAIPPDFSKPVRIRFCGKLDGKGGSLGKGSSSGMHRFEPYSIPSAALYQETQLMNAAAFGSSQTTDRKEAPPSDNLYITGLPLGLDNETLKAMFSQYGVVVQCKVLDPRPDATSSHALVRFSTVDEAVVVKQALSGYIMQGLSEPLLINYAIQKEKGLAKGDNGGKGGKSCEAGGGGLFWDELAPPQWEPPQWEGNGWKGDGCKGGGWKGDVESCWKGGPPPQAWTGEKGPQSWQDEEAPAHKGGLGKWDGGKGMDDGGKGGKGFFIGMDNVLQGFAEAKCLPGHSMTNDDNALHISGWATGEQPREHAQHTGAWRASHCGARPRTIILGATRRLIQRERRLHGTCACAAEAQGAMKRLRARQHNQLPLQPTPARPPPPITLPGLSPSLPPGRSSLRAQSQHAA